MSFTLQENSRDFQTKLTDAINGLLGVMSTTP